MEMTGMATDTASNVRDEFRNTTDGWIGVIQMVGPHREPKGTAVEPHGTVWLNEEEQILTANAPRADEDNPFANGQLELVSRGAEIKSRRPFGAEGIALAAKSREVVEEETGAAPTPEGEPAEGEHAAGEEVATPEAQPAGRRRRS
jgi:hypothetical protein